MKQFYWSICILFAVYGPGEVLLAITHECDVACNILTITFSKNPKYYGGEEDSAMADIGEPEIEYDEPTITATYSQPTGNSTLTTDNARFQDLESTGEVFSCEIVIPEELLVNPSETNITLSYSTETSLSLTMEGCEFGTNCTSEWEVTTGTLSIPANTMTYTISPESIPEGYYVITVKANWTCLGLFDQKEISFRYGAVITTLLQEWNKYTISFTDPIEHTGGGSCADYLTNPQILGTNGICEMGTEGENTEIILFFDTDGESEVEVMLSEEFSHMIIHDDTHAPYMGNLPSATMTATPEVLTYDTESTTIAVVLTDSEGLTPTISWTHNTDAASLGTLSFSSPPTLTETFPAGSYPCGLYNVSVQITLPLENGYLFGYSFAFDIAWQLSGAPLQEGNKFTFTTLYNYDMHSSFDCGDFIEAEHVGSLGSSPLCSHTNGTNVMTLYVSQDHSLSASSPLPLKHYINAPTYVVGKGLPEFTMSLTPNRTDDLDYATVTTIKGMEVNGEGLTWTYEWAQTSGPTLDPFYTTLNQQVYPANSLALGVYQFDCTTRISDSNGWLFQTSTSFEVFTDYTPASSTYIGNQLTFIFSSPYVLGADCSVMFTAESWAMLGTSPTCTMPQPNYFVVYFDIDAHPQVKDEAIYFSPESHLRPEFTLLHDLPFIVIDYDGLHYIEEDRNLTAVPTDLPCTPIYTFTQDAGGPDTLTLNSTELIQKWNKISLQAGTYNFQIRMQLPAEYNNYYRIATAPKG